MAVHGLLPPDSSFPMNFSVMTTVRAVKDSQVFLLSLYDSQVRIHERKLVFYGRSMS